MGFEEITPEKRSRVRHIPETSKEYRESQKRKAPTDKFFGAYHIMTVEWEIEAEERKRAGNGNSAEIQSSHTRAAILEKEFGRDNYEREALARRFAEYPKDSVQAQAAYSLIEKGFHDKELGPALKQKLGFDIKETDDFRLDMAKALREGRIDAELLYRLLEMHVKDSQERAERLRRKVEQYQKEFKDKVADAIAQGWLPLSMEQAEARLNNWPVSFFDPLDNPDLAQETAGAISASLNLLEAEEGELRHVVFHEGVHQLGGKSIIQYAGEYGIETIQEIKQGLLFVADGPGLKRNKAFFSWLNEAATDEIAKRLSGGTGTGKEAYSMFGLALKALIQKGVSEQSIINAFFEEYMSDEGKVLGLPHWNILAKELHQAGKDLAKEGFKVADFAKMFKEKNPWER